MPGIRSEMMTCADVSCDEWHDSYTLTIMLLSLARSCVLQPAVELEQQ
jgi:hypothetical protein